MDKRKEYIVKADLLITAETEEEAIENFRQRVRNGDASIFEVELWDGSQ